MLISTVVASAGVSNEYHVIGKSSNPQLVVKSNSSGHAFTELTSKGNHTQGSVTSKNIGASQISLTAVGIPSASSVTVISKSPSLVSVDPTAIVSTVPGGTQR